MKFFLTLLVSVFAIAAFAIEDPFFRLASNLPLKNYKAQVAVSTGAALRFSFAPQPGSISVEVHDFWSNLIWQGNVPAGEKTLELPPLSPGYYVLEGRCGERIHQSPFTVVGKEPPVSFDSPFGIGTHMGQGYEEDTVALARAAGFSWLRDEIGWGYVEQQAGKLDFSRTLAARLKRASEKINWLSVLSYGNKHYDKGSAPFTEEGYAAWRRYVRESVENYPAVRLFECWNEYNAGFNMYGITEPTPANYLKLLKNTCEEVKANRPDAEVVGGATATLPMEWIEELFKLGGLRYMDSFSVHPYRWGKWNLPPETLYHDLLEVRKLLERYAPGRKVPLIADEVGWPVDLRYQISESRQAAYLVRNYTNLQRVNTARIFWYDFMSHRAGGENFSISKLSRGQWYVPRPAYAAAAVMTRELAAGYLGPYACPEPGLATRYRGDLLCFWNREQKPAAFELLTSRKLTVTDMMGGIAELTPVDGRIALILGEYPVYIRGEVDGIVKSSAFDLQPRSLKVSEKAAMKFTFQAPADCVLHLGTQEFSPGRFEITGSSMPDTRNIRAEIRRNGKLNGLALLSIDIAPQFEIAMIRVLENGTIRADLTNLAPELRESVTAVKVSVDGKPQPAILPLPYAIPAGRQTAIDLLRIRPVPYQLHQLELAIEFAGHPALTFSGKVGYNPCYYRRGIKLDGTLKQWRSQPAIELASFGRMVSLAPDLRDTLNKLDGKVWIAWDEQNFYLVAEIRDPVHVQKYPVWQGDSLQFALAYAAPPDANTTVKADAAFNDRGHSWIFPSGPLGFDRQSLQKFSRICMTRQGERSVYELQLPWKYIRFVKPADRVFRFSMLANNNDDGRRMGYLEWGGGLGDTKGTRFYPVCEFKR